MWKLIWLALFSFQLTQISFHNNEKSLLWLENSIPHNVFIKYYFFKYMYKSLHILCFFKGWKLICILYLLINKICNCTKYIDKINTNIFGLIFLDSHLMVWRLHHQRRGSLHGYCFKFVRINFLFGNCKNSGRWTRVWLDGLQTIKTNRSPNQRFWKILSFLWRNWWVNNQKKQQLMKKLK